LLIKSIDVMSRKYYLGDTTLNGVLHYKTYKGDLTGFALPARDVIYPYSGIQIPASPVFRSYDTNRDNPLPDFRNLLYLDLSLKATNNQRLVVPLYTADSEGRYRVIIHGFGQSAGLIYGEQFINIQ